MFITLLPPHNPSSSTMDVLGFLKLSFLFSLLSPNSYSNSSLTSVRPPPTCNRIECPVYDVIDAGKDYEVRRYNSSMWISTSSIPNVSLVGATRTGFLRLFDYIQGKNEYNQKIEMTAPVITQVTPSDGPFCESSFTVSFYVPKTNQDNPPPAAGLHVQKWQTTHVAVRQFGGFVKDTDVSTEAAALAESIADTKWAEAIAKSHAAEPTKVYTVAQYNSPFEFSGRVNEIWFTFFV